MTTREKTKSDLNKKFRKVVGAPASFAFFQAIHGFIQYIERDSDLTNGLSHRIKRNQELGIPAKYAHLKQIYQGVEDSNVQSDDDLGHKRYMTICDLKRIQNKETSENNSFWKKRELFRRLTIQIQERLNVHLSRA